MKMKHLQKASRARIQEENAASRFAGRRQPASGSKLIAKLDVATPTMLIECKYTDAKSFKLTRSMWETVQREADKIGKTGIMELDIDGSMMYVVPKWVVEVFIEER